MGEQLLLPGFKLIPIWINRIVWCSMLADIVTEEQCEECDKNVGLDEYSTSEYRVWEDCDFRENNAKDTGKP